MLKFACLQARWTLLVEYSVHEKVTGHGSNDHNAFARNESISYCITMRTQC